MFWIIVGIVIIGLIIESGKSAKKGDRPRPIERGSAYEKEKDRLELERQIKEANCILSEANEQKEASVHIPAHHEHPFRTNVNTYSGST
ncbi:hypothetical protein ATG98_3544 [Marinobacter sp. LV10R520-4]|uniref:hypothetical protein n=1 Tax=Marinobacter sp. LV10R520-4 TaxID=1761796 RepID=UPI000BF98764|nr:hypothetical protein [Marinobacter sp. LV10R520-4]PFG54323.1 hypothetical protein ATG98_3544 [Marinobacter sp. LV10R520-4]